VAGQQVQWAAQLCNFWLGLHESEETAFATYFEAFRARFGYDVPGWEGWPQPPANHQSATDTSSTDAPDPADGALAEITGPNPTPKSL